MPRNATNAEREARKGRARVAELKQYGMPISEVVAIVAHEFCVQPSMVYKWLCCPDNTALNEPLLESEQRIAAIWRRYENLANYARQRTKGNRK